MENFDSIMNILAEKLKDFHLGGEDEPMEPGELDGAVIRRVRARVDVLSFPDKNFFLVHTSFEILWLHATRDLQ